MNQKPELRCINGNGMSASPTGASTMLNDKAQQQNTGLPSVLMKARRSALEELH